MRFFAVFDTNVLVSSLLTKNPDSATARMLNLILDGVITPVYTEEILDEYREVFLRPKFGFGRPAIDKVLVLLQQFGQRIEPLMTEEAFSADPDDRVFYEVVMAKRAKADESSDSYLITGNLKHFPVRPFIVTPAEMLAIIEATQSASDKSRESLNS